MDCFKTLVFEHFANTKKTASQSYFKEALLLWNNLEKHFLLLYSRNIAQCTLDISPKIPEQKMQNICKKGKSDEWKLGDLQLLKLLDFFIKVTKKKELYNVSLSWLRREQGLVLIRKTVIELNDLETELIFGATAATGGRVNFCSQLRKFFEKQRKMLYNFTHE